MDGEGKGNILCHFVHDRTKLSGGGVRVRFFSAVGIIWEAFGNLRLMEVFVFLVGGIFPPPFFLASEGFKFPVSFPFSLTSPPRGEVDLFLPSVGFWTTAHMSFIFLFF